jgi:hypothetical protein
MTAPPLPYLFRNGPLPYFFEDTERGVRVVLRVVCTGRCPERGSP